MDISPDQTNILYKKISDLEEKNKKLEETLERQGNKIDELITRLSYAHSAIDDLEGNVENVDKKLHETPSMEEIKKWTCEYVEAELNDIHPLKDRWESTDYLPEYGGCIGYYYCEPRTPSHISRNKAQIYYNRSEVMKQPEIKLSDI